MHHNVLFILPAQSFLHNATHLFSSNSDSKSGESAAASPASASSSSPAADPKGPAGCALLQGWMLMALAVSVFVPKSSKILWYLRTHFARNKDSR